MTTTAQEHNPYVGHRPFSRSETGLFFGRQKEAQELLALILSNKTLVLFGPSGIGKTSLVNAELIPLLENRGFEVIKERTAPNLQPPNRTENPELRIAIFDSFDTFFSSSSKRFKEREDFFRKMKEALEEDSRLRVVFVMRESHLAQLAPYAHFLPNQLLTRFCLGPLQNKTALIAVTGPLTGTQRSFEEEVAEELVNELSRVRSATDIGKIDMSTGVLIEPVLLQIACKHLWDNLPDDVTKITQNHLQAFGNVNRALVLFYEKSIQQANERSGAKEENLRRCFDQEFITHSKTRGMIYRGETETGGIPNEAMALLEEGHLVRSEEREGSIWYILIHDLLIHPILESNDAWRKKQREGMEIRRHLENKAIEWLRLGRKKELLLGQMLRQKAEGWMESPDGREIGYSEALNAYVKASREQVDFQHEEAPKPPLETHKQRRKVAETEEETEEEIEGQVEQPSPRPMAWQFPRFTFGLLVFFVLAGGTATFLSLQNKGAGRADGVTEIEDIPSETQSSLDTNKTRIFEEVHLNAEVKQIEAELVEAPVSIPTPVSISKIEPETVNVVEPAPTKIHKTGDISQDDGVEIEAKTDLVEIPIHTEVVVSDQETVQKERLNAERKKLDVLEAEREAIEKSIKAKQVLSRSMIAAAAENFESNPALSLSLIGHALSTSNFLKKEDRIRVETILYRSITTLPVKKIFSGHTGPVKEIIFSGNKKVLATAGKDAKLLVWNLSSKNRFRAVKQLGPVNGLAFGSQNGAKLAAVSDAGIVTVWNTLSGKKIRTLPEHAGRVQDIAFSPDGKRLATASRNTTASVWSLKSGGELVKLIGHTDAVDAVSFSPDGRHLGTAGQDGTARIWDAFSGILLVSLIGHTDPVMDVAFSPDGKHFATASKDGTARIWNPGFSGQGGVQLVLSGHTGAVLKISYSPDGRYIATASNDGTARVWDAKTGEELIRIRGRLNTMNSVSFSPDGKYLATASQDNKVRLYSLAVEDLMAAIPKKNIRLLTLRECKKYLHTTVCPKKS